MNTKYRFTAIYSAAERKKILGFFQFLDLAIIFLAPDFSIVDFNEHAQQFYGWERRDIRQQSYLEWCERHQVIPLFTSKDKLLLQRGDPILSVKSESPNKKGLMSWDVICNLSQEPTVGGIFLIGKKAIQEKPVLPYIQKPSIPCSTLRGIPTLTRSILLEDIISAMPCFVFWKDTNFVYLGCNDLIANVLGLPSREAIIGKTDYDFGWKKEDVDEYRKVDEKILVTGKPSYNVEETVRIKGKNIILLVNKVPIFNEYNEIVSIVGISIDITDRKQAEAALKEAKQVAEEANKAKSDFIGNMSHDIKTPLAGIIGIAECLAYTLEKKESIDYAQNIVAAGQQLIVFFDNCLEAAKIEHTEMTTVKEHFNLKTIIDEVIEMFKPAIKNKGLAAYLHYNSDVPESFIGSRPAIFRILMNLIGNAVKFTNMGSITLRITSEEKIAASGINKIKICIIDTGVGIPENMHTQIFERFVVLKPSNKGEAAKGSGLGLYLVKKLTEALHGEIYVSSQENQGSQFSVVLPLEIPVLVNENNGKNNAHLPPYQQIYPIDLMKVIKIEKVFLARKTSSELQLLLVEDNILAQKAAELMLTSFNCKVDIANCGAQALKLFEVGKYHLIFMDLGLPDLSGCEIASHFRKMEEGDIYRAPIIALTAHVNEEIKKECQDVGMDEILSKPLSLEQARNMVDYYASLLSNKIYCE